MGHHVKIADLPVELSLEQAVENVCREELRWIYHKLSQKISVLVECDKQLSIFLYKILRSRFGSENAYGEKVSFQVISGRAGKHPGGIMGNMVLELAETIQSGVSNNILVFFHLDILTSSGNTLTAETKEVIAWLYENPNLTFLAFKDPSFELPKVLQDLFSAKKSIVGLPRASLPRIILQREAKKFGLDEFNPYLLYKYVSGLNPVRFRQILSLFADKYNDFHPQHPETMQDIFRELRELTLGNLEIPIVDLWKDIGGYQKIKEQLHQEILLLLEKKETWENEKDIEELEALLPRGIIFTGPPGTGKTYFAKAMATALNATITIVSGPELKSKWVGESEENLRRIFSQARKAAPSIIVFDEIDSFCTTRGTYLGSGVEHSMVNQLLTEMDGFRKEELVFVVGTTNFIESIDPALLRPGRFEYVLEIPYPKEEDRRAILEIYNQKFKLALSESDLNYLQKRTNGFVNFARKVRFSGDHLYAIMRALKRMKLREGDSFKITEKALQEAIRRKGNKRKLTPEEEHSTAVHEAGHALIACLLRDAPEIEKVTISSEEDDLYLGAVFFEEHKKFDIMRSEILDHIAVSLGGRTAELLLLEDISAGAQNDLEIATEA
ncbi:MAG: AAA family ATPase, partial [Planctomycetota bacterium]